MLRNGTLVSGGKDRRLVSWDSSYQQIQTVEVRKRLAEITRIQIFSSFMKNKDEVYKSHVDYKAAWVFNVELYSILKI